MSAAKTIIKSVLFRKCQLRDFLMNWLKRIADIISKFNRCDLLANNDTSFSEK